MIKHDLLPDMMLFLSVVDSQSFTSAAKKLGYTKSLVSKRITRLEKSLGTQLLRRSTRQLSLTEAGQTVYDRSLRIKYEIEETEAMVSSNLEKPQGNLRVNCTFSFGHLHLAPAIADFMQKYPDIKVQLLLGQFYDNLIEYGIDVAIRIGNLPDSGLIARRLCEQKMRVCASPDYLARMGIPHHPEDLYQHNCLIHENSPLGRSWHFQKDGKEYHIDLSGNFSATNSLALEAVAIQSTGLIMLPEYMVSAHLKSGALVAVLEDYCPNIINISAVYSATRHLAPKIRLFIDFLLARFQEKTYWNN